MSRSATAIIPAAGHGTRFGGPMPKQVVSLGGRPLIEHTLACFEAAHTIQQVILAVRAEDRASLAHTLQPKFPKLAAVVDGGADRQESVYRGLQAVGAHPETIVAVHDAVRPFVRPALIDRAVEIAAETGGCILARPIHDTLKRVNAGEVICETVDRAGLWAAQTPQVFRAGLLAQAFAVALRDGFRGTDEAALVERLGVPLRVLVGDPWNIKITTLEDLAIAEAIVNSGLV